MRTVFIYALCEPGTRTVRYIGQTVDFKKRFRNHCNQSVNGQNPLGDWLRSLEGRRPEMIVLSEVPECEWGDEEQRYIRAARMLGMRLVNSTDGGEGLLGFHFSEETKMKKSRRFSGAGNPMFGKPVSSETRERLSVASLEAWKNPEMRAEASRRRTGRQHTPETKEKMRLLALARPYASDAHRAAISEGLKGRVISPEHAEKRRAGHRLYLVLQHSKKFYGDVD